MYMSFKEIYEEQRRPLEYKIETAVEHIGAAFSLSTHNAAIAFSGGKDSTVLWHLIRERFPDKSPYIIFGNTGVEFPESLKFARELGREWGGDNFRETKLSKTEAEGLKYEAQRETLDWLVASGRVGEVLKSDGKLKSTAALEKTVTPEMWDDFRARGLIWKEGTIKSYWWCADQYGFPIMGKSASLLDARRINIDCFLLFSKSTSKRDKLAAYYDVLRECRFSQHCCKLLKKDPSEQLQAELDVDVLFKGLMAAESRTRRTNFATRGYIFKSTRPHLGEDAFYHVNPLSIWTDDDIWDYILRYNVPYAPLYDMGYTDEHNIEHKIKRNGCLFCATDILYRDNHMAMLRRTHPRQWQSVMDYGMGQQLKKLIVATGGKNKSLLDLTSDNFTVFDAPCAFDQVDDNRLPRDEYDGEMQ
jgi:3'-phosphoadenosine 5'-phosphosulfate sulfotransferase (PAPS reductase)/FAD synthetase